MDIEALKGVIIEEFIKQFNEKGPKVTLDSVCKEIHISKKTIYKVFQSKTDIFNCILLDALSAVKEGQKKIYEDASLPFKQKIYDILTIPFPRQDEVDLSKIGEFNSYDPEFYAAVLDAYRPNWGMVESLIEQGKALGEVRQDVDRKLSTLVIMDALMGLFEKDRLKALGLTYSEALGKIVSLVLNGIYA